MYRVPLDGGGCTGGGGGAAGGGGVVTAAITVSCAVAWLVDCCVATTLALGIAAPVLSVT